MGDSDGSGTGGSGASSSFDALLKDVARPPQEVTGSAPDLLGVTLQQYRVVAVLGRGGMGVVYRAQDTRLGRAVALKVLPRELAGNPDRRRRFLREARSAAAIAHPNIATVFEADEADGRVFLVMELVEGETLRRKLRAGPIAVAEALRIGKAIARGMAKAHDRGIVHRDLKPENVMVTNEGDVKILDFGLAKLRADAVDRSEVGSLMTDMNVTEEGVVVGTLSYMSPEQASGVQVDVRADIFSLGVMLYELVTGRLPFEGATRHEMLAAILRDEPAPLPRRVLQEAPVLEVVIQRCLRKKAEERFASATEVLAALETGAPRPSARLRRRSWAMLGVAGVAATGAFVVTVAFRSSPRGLTTSAASASSVPAAPSASAAPTASAAGRVTRIVDLPPPTTAVPAAAAAYASGIQALHDDSWFKATGLFAKAAELDPTMAAAHLRLAITLLIANDPESRRGAYEKAAGLRTQLDARDQALLAALQPMLQSAVQDARETDRRLRALAERYPGDAEIWMLLGLVHYGTATDTEPATRALELDPGDAQSWESKGHGLLAVGDTAGARAAYERCGALSIDGADCFAWAGMTYSQEGRCAEFEREEHKAADREHFWLAPVLWAMGSMGRPLAALDDTGKQFVAAAAEAGLDAGWMDAGVKTRLAIFAGDFTRAAGLARSEAAMVERNPTLRTSYSAHFYLATHLVDIALETGDAAGLRRAVQDFTARRDTWVVEATFGHTVDLSLAFARLAYPDDAPPPAAFDEQRRAWTDRAWLAGADEAQIWDYAYASPASTAEEARAALDALATMGPATPTPSNYDDFFGRHGSPEADLGRVQLLAGHLDEAIRHLRRAVARCDDYISTLDHVRAALNLGRALEMKGDTAGACAAYDEVLERWGHATPRSLSAEGARARSRALACPRPG